MSDFQVKKGTRVEIKVDEEGFQGVCFTAKIISPPTKTTKKVLVEYETLLADNGKKPLREKVDLGQIRPIQPKETDLVFKLDDIVDAYYNDGWWEGVITQVLYGCSYSVFFKHTKEEYEFKASDLRLHREWDGQNWVPPLDEEAQPTADEKIDCEETYVFSKGSRVEVSSDEEGFEGAWFVGSVIEVISKDKYLVEYKDLTTEDNTQYVREEIDSLHIRPCPPTTEKVPAFKQYDEVDAHYNDGWWVGMVAEVLGRSKYKVYFKNTDEEMEFKHHELRKHQDWSNGRWILASEGLNLTK